MITINGIELPIDTVAIRLEPAALLDKAVHSYSEDDDILVYYIPTLIECFMEQGMDLEEAWDWFNYNTLGTYVDHYPAFIDHEDDVHEDGQIL